MISIEVLDTVALSMVKRSADQSVVADGDVLAADLIGAADVGRLRQSDSVINARRSLLKIRRYWYTIMLDLREYMVAVSRIVVNHDGNSSTALDLMTWEKGGILKDRTPHLRFNIDLAVMAGPITFWQNSWCLHG